MVFPLPGSPYDKWRRPWPDMVRPNPPYLVTVYYNNGNARLFEDWRTLTLNKLRIRIPALMRRDSDVIRVIVRSPDTYEILMDGERWSFSLHEGATGRGPGRVVWNVRRDT